jgi:hypothetical protein
VVFQNFLLLAIVREWLSGGPSFWFSFWFPVISLLEMKYWNAPCREAKVAIGSFQLLRPCSDRYKRATTNGMPKAFGQQLLPPSFLFYMSIGRLIVSKFTAVLTYGDDSLSFSWLRSSPLNSDHRNQVSTDVEWIACGYKTRLWIKYSAEPVLKLLYY